jgi:hypothetical protein
MSHHTIDVNVIFIIIIFLILIYLIDVDKMATMQAGLQVELAKLIAYIQP